MHASHGSLKTGDALGCFGKVDSKCINTPLHPSKARSYSHRASSPLVYKDYISRFHTLPKLSVGTSQHPVPVGTLISLDNIYIYTHTCKGNRHQNAQHDLSVGTSHPGVLSRR